MEIAESHALAMRNTARLADIYTRYANGDREAIFQALHPDASWCSEGSCLPWGGHRQGAEGARDYFAQIDAVAEVIGNEVEQVIAQGDWVIALVTVTVRYRANGAVESYRKVDATRLRDGLVAEYREYYDSARVQAALTVA